MLPLNLRNIKACIYEFENTRRRDVMHYPISAQDQEVLAKLRMLRSSLRPAERAAADLILADPRG